MQPTLIHPQRVTATIPASGRKTDLKLREPAGRQAGTSITFYAQVALRRAGDSLDGQTEKFGSLLPEADGYLIAKSNSIASTLTKGSKITRINYRTVDLLVLDIVPCGHYIEESTLLYIPFKEANV